MTDRPTIDQIIEAAAEVCAVGIAEILSNSRQKSVGRARQAAMITAVRRYGYTSVQVGSALKRDHTTVLHALKRDVINHNLVDDIANEVVGGAKNTTRKVRESGYGIPDRNDIAMVRFGADKAERALIALLRLDYGHYEIELQRTHAKVDPCSAD